MALKRFDLGDIVKDRDGSKPDYIKVTQDMVLKKGDFLKVESPKAQLASLTRAIEEGKLSGEIAEKMLEKAQKKASLDFVRASVYILKEKE